MSGTPAGGSGSGSAGSSTGALDREHAQHLAGADERARDLLDRLGRGAQRDHEEPCVAVERDELARP